MQYFRETSKLYIQKRTKLPIIISESSFLVWEIQDNKLVLFPPKVGADIPGARVKPELLEKLEELSRGKFQLDIKGCVTYN
jgi:hypothetical protein